MFWPLASQGGMGPRSALHVPILMYHRIVDPALGKCDRPALCVPPAMFAAQLGRLAAAGWHTITMADLAFHLATGTVPAPRTFVITIDDGHADGYTNGLPILERYGFVATYYVVTGRLGHGSDLQPGDLATLARAGMEIGDHTVDHVNLDLLPPMELARQVRSAAATIDSIVGERPVTFAYPFGDRDPAVVAAVAAARFGAAVTNRDVGAEDWANRFELPRIEIGAYLQPSYLLAEVTSYAGRSNVGSPRAGG